MNKLSLLSLSIFSLFLMSGCAGRQTQLPIKIGLLADTQITSPNSTPDSIYRNKSSDKTVEVAIRPPALEYLAPQVLKIALDKLSKEDDKGKKVDVILYLGDGANSGGEDELESLFNALSEHRNETKIPTFMVIGNHDYLGAGNVSNEGERMLLVNRIAADENPPSRYNRPLSTYQVLQKISRFNADANFLSPATNFKYADNRDSLDANLNHRTGLYLAGHLLYSASGKDNVEIFLADTSDYQNMPIKPEAMKLGFYGWEGSISSKDKSGKNKPAQIDSYFKNNWAISSPDFRFIASHYHPDNLDRKRFVAGMPEDIFFELENTVHGVFETADSLLFGQRYSNQYLDRWVSKGANNYWLSGHTHRQSMISPRQGKVNVGGIPGFLAGTTFRSVNIGSTTDYRAHVVILEGYVKGKDIKIDKKVGYRQIPVFDYNARLLEDIFAGLNEFGAQKRGDPNFSELKNMDNLEFGVSVVGLNKQYQQDYWTPRHTEASVKYLNEFIARFCDKHPEFTRSDVVSCLAFIASANEEGKNPFKSSRS